MNNQALLVNIFSNGRSNKSGVITGNPRFGHCPHCLLAGWHGRQVDVVAAAAVRAAAAIAKQRIDIVDGEALQFEDAGHYILQEWMKLNGVPVGRKSVRRHLGRALLAVAAIAVGTAAAVARY